MPGSTLQKPFSPEQAIKASAGIHSSMNPVQKDLQLWYEQNPSSTTCKHKKSTIEESPVSHRKCCTLSVTCQQHGWEGDTGV